MVSSGKEEGINEPVGPWTPGPWMQNRIEASPPWPQDSLCLILFDLCMCDITRIII